MKYSTIECLRNGKKLYRVCFLTRWFPPCFPTNDGRPYILTEELMELSDLILFLNRVSKDYYRYGKTGDSKEALKWRAYIENVIRTSGDGSREGDQSER